MSVNVPDEAFKTQETVNVSLVSPASVTKSVQGLTTASVAAVLNVTFSGASPTKPVTVTITNPGIAAGGVVYKLTSDGKLVALQATVIDGKATVSFTSAPTFVVVNLKRDQRVMTMVGHANIVPGLVKAASANGTKTTYMPIWYVMQLLKQAGIQSTWNGTTWAVTK